jgi:uncharacterized membrane protein
VFLEELEIVFIVITFGLAASKDDSYGMLVAAASAILAGLLVLVAGVIARPLSTPSRGTG